MKKLLPYLLLSLFLLAVFLIVSNTLFINKNRVAYIDNTTLFSGFHMAVELQKEGIRHIRKQEKILDSLYANLEAKDSVPSQVERQLLSRELDKLQEIKNRYTNESIQQVWDRLNNYIQLYGEQKGYSIILGAQGSGNIMFADKGLDITEEVLEFVNKKYEGN